MTTLENYPLGYSEAEAKRLMEQGAMLQDLTRDLLSRAGLTPGMRVRGRRRIAARRANRS